MFINFDRLFVNTDYHTSDARDIAIFSFIKLLHCAVAVFIILKTY